MQEYMISRYPEYHSLDTTVIEMAILHGRPKSADSVGEVQAPIKGTGVFFIITTKFSSETAPLCSMNSNI
jgi:hypothetical protein